MRNYIRKFKGIGDKSRSRPSRVEFLWSVSGVLISVSALALLQKLFFGTIDGHGILMAPLGASAVLVFGAPNSTYSQPRNLVLGHVLSAFAGTLVSIFFSADFSWLACGLAVSLAFLIMEGTDTMHPPGGATALIGVIGDKGIHDLGFYYIFMPAGIGALILLLVALVFNNMARSRQYPRYWR